MSVAHQNEFFDAGAVGAAQQGEQLAGLGDAFGAQQRDDIGGGICLVGALGLPVPAFAILLTNKITISLRYKQFSLCKIMKYFE
ncbi:hypothetical protein GV829_08245 [Sphingomonas lacunae]|uniref:Uncharacterized protein n=1 Tax=Sphingomonas lacunae TaxID=2698828 RepID=A0A6M4AVL9_9SPHN|nr:hypothetical protein [Sphingomonas lacunae]QJQ32440.1 hypothetical protein GV829_08245 [Sphingomonas lacunae]